MGVKHRSPQSEYYSLDFLPCEKKQLNVSAFHDRYENLSGKINIMVQTLSRIYVGTGEYESASIGLYQPFSRKNGKPMIPGTALKGVVRSYAEAISASCEGGKCKDTKLCICCRIFGSTSLQGRVFFTDTDSVEPADAGLAIYPMKVRRSGGYKEGRRFYYHNKPEIVRAIDERTQEITPQKEELVETVSWNVNFSGKIFFENLEKIELGLLLLAMGLYDEFPFYPKLGGGKNRKLGSIRFDLTDGIEIMESNRYESFSPKNRKENLDSWGREIIGEYLKSLSPSNRALIEANLDAFNTEAGSRD